MIEETMEIVGASLEGPNGDLILWVALAVVLGILGIAMWIYKRPTKPPIAKPRDTPFVAPVDAWANKPTPTIGPLEGVKPVAQRPVVHDQVAPELPPRFTLPYELNEIPPLSRVDKKVQQLKEDKMRMKEMLVRASAEQDRAVAAAERSLRSMSGVGVDAVDYVPEPIVVDTTEEARMYLQDKYDDRDELLIAIGESRPAVPVTLDGKVLWGAQTGVRAYRTNLETRKIELISAPSAAVPAPAAPAVVAPGVELWPRIIHVGGVNVMAKAPINEAWRPGLTASVLGRPPQYIADPSNGDLVNRPLRSPKGFPLSYTVVKNEAGQNTVIGTATIFHADNGFTSDDEVLAYIAATTRTPAEESAIAAQWARGEAEIRQRLTERLPIPERVANEAK